MSEIEISQEPLASDETNNDFVDWINSLSEENRSLTYPFRNKWTITCKTLWVFIFIICVVIFIVVLLKDKK